MKKRNLLVLIFALILCACFIGCGGCGEIDPINIEDDNITIKRIGDTYQLTTTGGDDNKVWSCLDTSVATVSETGLVTAVANGITEVTVTSANVTDVCVINVKQAILPEPGLMVSFAKSAVVLNGFSKETYTVETIVTKNNQEIEADLTWTNSDTDGEYITFENGVITAKANTPLGKPVVITCRATYGEEWAEASLYVTVEDDTDITFLTSETLFYYAPEAPENITIPVTAKINGMDATEPIVLSTSNEGIAKIEGDEIKLVAAGDVTIYATVNNKTKGYAIHIRAKYFVDTVDELKAISQGSDDVAYELRNDITVEIPDFTREDIGGTGTKTVAVYLVDKFKGELFGKGYKITYNYNSGYYGDFTEETFRGLFKTVEPTALIKDTVFVANLRLDHPHMYSFIYQNHGRVESCFVYSNRRQVAAGTGYQNHYNDAGGIFERNHGIVTDTVIVGNFFKDEHGTTSIGDNLVMAGSKNAGKFDNVAFVSARTAIGNHRNANWDGNGAMGRDELTYLVRYDDMNAFANKEGERVTNPNDTSDYSQDLYVRTECTDQELSTKWEIGAENIKLENKDAWIKASVETNVNTLDFVPGEAETAQVTATSDHSSQEFEFKSEDTDVAVVDANGIVSKIGIGRTRIVATHKVSGEQKAVLVAVLKKVDVTSKEEFLALKDADNTTYASLTTDINLDMDDVVRTADVTVANEVFIPNLKAYIDGNGHTVNISYTSHELDVEQKVQIEGEEEGVTETIIVKNNSNFVGLFGTVASTANIRNLSVQGFIDNIRDSATIFASTLSSGAKIENCFINVETYQVQSGKWNEDEQTWKNQYWSQALKVISSNYGAIENSIIQVNNRHGNSVAGVPLQSHWTGTWTNVAQVGITHGGAWYNFGGQKKINANQLDNVVHYTDLQNIASGVGRDWTVANGSYSFTNITGVQDFGSAWTISADEIKLKGESVWKKAEVTTDVSEIVLIEGRDTTANITALVDGADNENIVFVSSNEDVVTVSSAGVVTAVGKGIAKVRAVYAGNIATVTVKVLESRAIATKEEFLALGELDSAVYAYLTNDIILTTEDAIRLSNTTANESFIANFASNLDGNGYKIVATYTSHKVNVEETVDVEGTPTVQTVEKDSNFHGIFKSVSGSITGLNVELTVNGGFDGGALFAYELTAEGTLTDSFVRANVTMTASGSGNWYSTWGIIKSNYGRIESSIVSANGHGNRSVPLQTHQSGKWVNVAYVVSDKAGGYSNQGAGKLLNTDQLVNVAYYKSFTDLVSGKGESWTSTGTAKGSYVYTALTNAQDLGSAWVISNAEFNESIKLNGNVVWQTDVIEVTDKADFIAKMNSATDSTVLRLTQDLSFTTNDFTREDNGSTGVRNKDVYLIKSFKGTLFGNGKKITWELIPENVSNKDLCDSSVKGLIYNLESTAKLIGCNFQGVTHVPYDSATAFIENVFGTIDRCFIDSSIVMHNGNHYLNATGTFGKHAGVIKNSVIKSSGYTGGVATGTDKGAKIIHTGQSGSNGIFENIAFIQGTKRIGTKNNGNSNGYISTDQLVNFVYYPSFEALVKGEGEQVRNDNTDATFEYTAITSKQDLGSSWIIDDTEFCECIKLNGNNVWKTNYTVLEVTDEADFIAKMNSATESTALRLTQDLTFNTAHFTRENNGGTGAQSVDVYLIKSFKGVLLGNGKTISWELIPEDCASGNTAESYVKGLIYTVESTATIKGCIFKGITHVPYDFSTGFIEDVNGRIEDCYISVDICMRSGNNYSSTVGIFGTNAGVIKNCIVKGDVYTGSTNTGTPNNGAKIIHNGASANTGTFEGVALVQAKKNIGTTNNANQSYIKDAMLVDLVYYSSLDNLISATGEQVRNQDATASTFEYTTITEAQSLGSAWTIDSTGIRLNGTYVYQVTAG